MSSFLVRNPEGRIQYIWWAERMDLLPIVYFGQFSIPEMRGKIEELEAWRQEHEPLLEERACEQVDEMIRYLRLGIQRQEHQERWLAQCDGREVDHLL